MCTVSRTPTHQRGLRLSSSEVMPRPSKQEWRPGHDSGVLASQALRGEASSKSLVLLDEVGTGTEPVSRFTVA